jgi:hypothetical protein
MLGPGSGAVRSGALQQPCFIVREANGQALAYVYGEDEPGRRAAAKLLTRDEAGASPPISPSCRGCCARRKCQPACRGGYRDYCQPASLDVAQRPIAIARSKGLPVFRTPKHSTKSLRIAATTNRPPAARWPQRAVGIRTFKLSNDPKFAEKLEDIVGLYVDPPAYAVVLSVDEKSQIQALDRTQPGLPMKPGRAGTMTHDYKRHGTTALNILDGTVIGHNMKRHRHQEFIRFLNTIEAQVPKRKAISGIQSQ